MRGKVVRRKMAMRIIAATVSIVMAFSMVPAVALAHTAPAQLRAGALDYPFTMEETTYGVEHEDVIAKKLVITDTEHAKVVGYDNDSYSDCYKATAGRGYLLVKEDNARDGFFHLYVVASSGVAHEFQNIDEAMIDGVSFASCPAYIGEGQAVDGGALNDNSAYQAKAVQLYSVYNPARQKYDVFNANTGVYYEHEFDSINGIVDGLVDSAFGQAGVREVKKDDLYGFLKSDGSMLYKPVFSSYSSNLAWMWAKTADGKYAVLTPNGSTALSDGTVKGDLLWDFCPLGEYSENAKFVAVGNDRKKCAIMRLSDGELLTDYVYDQEYDVSAYEGDVLVSGGGSGSDVRPAMIFNDANPVGVDISARYSSSDCYAWYFYRGVLGGYVVKRITKDWVELPDGSAYNDTEFVLLDESANEVYRTRSSSCEAILDESGYSTDEVLAPCGWYRDAVVYAAAGRSVYGIDLYHTGGVLKKAKLECCGRKTKGEYIRIEAFGTVIACCENGGDCDFFDIGAGDLIASVPMAENASKPYSMFGNLFLKVTDFGCERIGYINTKTGVFSGFDYTSGPLSDGFSDYESGVAFMAAYDADGKLQMIDARFREVPELMPNGDILPFFVNTSIKTVTVQTGISGGYEDYGEGTKAYTIYSYDDSSLSLAELTSFETPIKKRWLSGGNSLDGVQAGAAAFYTAGSNGYGMISCDGEVAVVEQHEYARDIEHGLAAFLDEIELGDDWDDDGYTPSHAYALTMYDRGGGLLVRGDFVMPRWVSEYPDLMYRGSVVAVWKSAARADGEEARNTYYFYDFNGVDEGSFWGHARVTEKMLYTTLYSRYLRCSAFNKDSQRVLGAIADTMRAEPGVMSETWSALVQNMSSWKETLENAAKNFITVDEEGHSLKEAELYEELALELVEGMMECNEIKSLDFFNETETGFKFVKWGKAILESSSLDAETRLKMIELLERISTPDWARNYISPFVRILKDSEKCKAFFKGIQDGLDFLDDTFDVMDVIVSYAVLLRVNVEIVHELKASIPSGTGLYVGLERLEGKLLYPSEHQILDLVLDAFVAEKLKDFVKKYGIESLFKIGFEETSFSGAIAAAELGYFFASWAISKTFNIPSLDTRSKAQMAYLNVSTMRGALQEYAEGIIDRNERNVAVDYEKSKERFQMLFSAYGIALDKSVAYLKDVMGDKTPAKPYESIYERTKDCLTYESYIRSCRMNAESTWGYLVNDGKVVINKYNPGASGKNWGGAYSVDVPSSIEVDGVQCRVIGVDTGTFNGSGVVSVSLPDTVTSVGAGAFDGETSLQAVYVTGSLQAIDVAAFGEGVEGVALVGDSSSALDTFASAGVEGIDVEQGPKVAAEGGLELATGSGSVRFDDEGRADVSDVRVVATYLDGTSEEVSSGFIAMPKDASTAIVHYAGQTVEAPAIDAKRGYTVSLVDEHGMAIAPMVLGYASYGELLLEAPAVEGYEPVETQKTVELSNDACKFELAYHPIAVDMDIKDARITLSESAMTYTGENLEPQVTVAYGGKKLVKGVDFEIEYADNIRGAEDESNPGAYWGSVYVAGIGDYVGIGSARFEIVSPIWLTGIAKVKLAKTAFTWNGKAQAPDVTEVTAYGGVIPKGSYRVSYSPGRKDVGTYKVTVEFTGRYAGGASSEYQILPKGTFLKKLKKAKKSFIATWAKQAAQTTGYELRYSLKKSMKGAKTKVVKKAKTVKLKVKGLKAKKRYYVQIRTYKNVGGKKYYSAWSKAKAVKVR